MDEWEYYRWYPDLISASVFAGWMWQVQLDAQVFPAGLAIGSWEGCWVLVPKGMSHRARWLEQTTALAERELTFLSTGEFGGDSDNSGESHSDEAA